MTSQTKGHEMPAAVEVSMNGFEAAFASRSQPAWHNLGVTFDGDVTTAEMLRLAYLADWDIQLVPVEVPGVSPDRFAKEQYATVRTNPFDGELDALGFVGGRYKVSQNEEILGFGDALLDGGRWETAGSINGGTRIFASLALDHELVIDPSGVADVVNSYLLVTTSHDGSSPIMALNTPVRAVCQNTLNLAISGAKQAFKVRHTTTLEGKIAVAREALGIADDYFAKFGTFATALFETPMDVGQFIDMAKVLYPEPEGESKNAATRWENKITLLGDIFTGTGDGPNTSAGVSGTAWGGFNAMTEALDWYRKPRKENPESVLSAASGFDPVINQEKARITKAFASLV